jgi:hypothetical protein
MESAFLAEKAPATKADQADLPQSRAAANIRDRSSPSLP